MVVSLSFHLVLSLYSQPSVGTSSRSVPTLLNPPTFWYLSPISQWPFSRERIFWFWFSIWFSYHDRIWNVQFDRFSKLASCSLFHLFSCKHPVYQSGHHKRYLYWRHSGSSNSMCLRYNRWMIFKNILKIFTREWGSRIVQISTVMFFKIQAEV